MNFDAFAKQVPKIKNLPLLGEEAHFKMAPAFRSAELKRLQNQRKNAKQSAVLSLFYPSEKNTVNLLLMLRKTYKGVHSNQVGFPGGKVEKDDLSLMHTALRETHEEVGVHPKKIEIVSKLSSIYIPPSNFEVHPYIGLYSKPSPFVIQESEVELLIEVPLTDFMDDEKIITQNLSTSYAKNVDVPAFKLNGYIVWGATAMMLSELKDLLKQVL